jgi:Beta-L-arabinofuranosidase, GH127 catalytic domain
MVEPVLERVPRAAFSIEGWLGERIALAQRNWLLAMPAANPALLEMFRDRDRDDRHPSRDLLPWSGEFAGKHLISGAQFVRVTGDPELRARFETFVRDLIECQDSDGYLGPFEHRARMIGEPESMVWTNVFPADDRPGEWNGWFPLGVNVFPQATAVTALSTVPGGTSLYVVGFDGKVWTNFFPAADGSPRWNGWFALPGDNVFPERSTVTALSTVPGGTSLYVLGLDRKVWTNFFPAPDRPGEWDGWWPLVFPAYTSWLPMLPGLQATVFSRDNPLRVSRIA